MKKQAILFGLNYAQDPRARLRGCINDVQNMGRFLQGRHYDVHIYTDTNEKEEDTTAEGIITHMTTLGQRTWTDSLTHVWIHFSGHGTQQRDWSGDELDGQDECIVPSDYKTAGLVTDDCIKKALSGFNPNTVVTLVFDCCHSGSICDLKFNYTVRQHQMRMLPVNKAPSLPSKTIMISGCMDHQTSADAYNVQHRHRFTGAMTSCLLLVLQQAKSRSLTSLFIQLHHMLRVKGFTQLPQLSTSFPLLEHTPFPF